MRRRSSSAAADDPRARLLHRLELRPHLRVQPRVDEREPRRRRDCLDQLRLVAQRRVVDEDRERLALRARSASPRGPGRLPEPRARLPAASTYSPRSGSQRPTSSVGSSSASRELVADPVDGRLLEMDDELADVHAREPRAQQPREQRERQTRSAPTICHQKRS